MFEKILQQELKAIFDLDKVTYALASESQEQEGVFVEIESAKTRILDARQVCRVTGKLRIFGNADKLPYGYFSKKIAEADPSLTKNLFFYDFEENTGRFQNIVERTLSFIYLFDSQYNPAIGTLNEIVLTYPEG